MVPALREAGGQGLELKAGPGRRDAQPCPCLLGRFTGNISVRRPGPAGLPGWAGALGRSLHELSPL